MLAGVTCKEGNVTSQRVFGNYTVLDFLPISSSHVSIRGNDSQDRPVDPTRLKSIGYGRSAMGFPT